jgi:small-conductance mechanosensitive channel
MSDPNDRYAGLTDEERAFAEGLGDDFEPTPAEGGTPQDPPQEGDPGEPGEQGVDTPESADQPEGQDDPLAALPEDIRNRYVELESAQRTLAAELEKVQAREAQLRNDNAAMAGRLKPLQQRLAELERGPAPRTEGSVDAGADEIAALFATEDFAEFERMFPHEAKLQKEKILGAVSLTEKKLQSEIAGLKRQLEDFTPVIDQLRTQREELDWQKRVDALASAHPDFQQIDKQPEFWNWFNGEYTANQPAIIRQQLLDPAVRKQIFSDPESTSAILTTYKKARTPATTTAAPPAPSAPAAKEVDPRLALSVAPNVGSSATRAVNIAALPPEEQFLAGLNS